MNRREFLRRALSLAPALIVVPPVVKYFLPPPGGWARFSGYDFVLWGETTLEAVFDRHMGRIMRDAYEHAMHRAFNPPLIADDLMTFGTAVARVVPGAVHRVPPHEWHTLEMLRA